MSAPTVYVSPSGSDANSGLTTSSPLKSVDRAVTLAGNGGTVLLQSGTYTWGNGIFNGIYLTNSTVTISGGFDAAYANQSGNSILDGAGSPTPLLLISNNSYFDTLCNLTFRNVNGGSAVRIIGGSSITFTNCGFISNSFSTDGNSVWASGIAGIGSTTFNNCSFNGNSTGSVVFGTNDFYLQINNSVLSNNSSATLIRMDGSGTLNMSSSFLYLSSSNTNGIWMDSTSSSTLNLQGNSFFVDTTNWGTAIFQPNGTSSYNDTFITNLFSQSLANVWASTISNITPANIGNFNLLNSVSGFIPGFDSGNATF
jgi:hypothetical protein